jgi:hypothetical protein
MSDNFDSLALSNDLMQGGFPREQAEALASAMVRLIDSHLVTRAYLDQRLAAFKVEIFQGMFVAMVVQAGLIVGLIKLL